MVYGRIIFNNVKEYTPSWIKTIPYSQVTKPTFGEFFAAEGFYSLIIIIF